MMAQMGPMMHRMGAAMFAAQTADAVGGLSEDVVSGTEVGLPLVPGHAVALLPSGVRALSEGLEVDPAEVRLYLAAREAARSRLFTAAPWLTASLTSAVQAYARDISIDVEGISARMSTVDPSDPAAAPYINIFATQAELADDEVLNRLVEIYQTNDEVQAGALEASGGTGLFTVTPKADLQAALAEVKAELQQ